jgi:hypothetical protein
MEEGIEIHERARALFKDGQFSGEAVKTAKLIADSSVPIIFEAAFEHDGYAARADMLSREPQGFKLVEVKSSLHNNDRVDSDHIDDMAYTAMVLRAAGVRILKAELILLSRDFRLGMNDAALFVASDHTDAVLARADEFLEQWPTIQASILNDASPKPELILNCKKCHYFESHCVGKGVKHSILELPMLREARFDELKSKGFFTITAIPADFDLSENQARVATAVRDGKPIVDSALLKKLLASIRWPAYFLDFETAKTALPLWPDVAPHEQVVTQYSLHVCTTTGKVEQLRTFLADPTKDCRRELAERLLADLGNEGTIVVYSSFEKTMLTNLAKRFPDLAPGLEACIKRLFDLEKVFKDAYYHPDFCGSTSIKQTLPVLVPGMNYDGLTIKDGDTAMAAFTKMARGRCNADEAKAIRDALLEYCGQDTLAMVRLHEAVSKVVA